MRLPATRPASYPYGDLAIGGEGPPKNLPDDSIVSKYFHTTEEDAPIKRL
jgi:hypothetical protein